MDFAPAAPANLASISFTALESPDEQVRSVEVSRLLKVCETVGFFYLTDHGVPKSLIHRVLTSSREFFMLPEDIKQQYGRHVQVFTPKEIRGYSIGIEDLNPGVDSDNKQIFELGNERPLVAGRRYTGPNVLPPDEIAPDFGKSHMEINGIVVRRLVPVLARALALALCLEEEFFTNKMTESDMIVTQRASFYPSGSGSCGRHTDSGLFTLLLQETQMGCSSLKLFSEGKWRNVEAKEDIFVVNLANILQYWTNGRFVSTPHQVVHRGSESRISVPFFVYPNADAEIIPLGKSKDMKVTTAEVYDEDLADIWDRSRGAGRWAKKCLRNAECGCWRCM